MTGDPGHLDGQASLCPSYGLLAARMATLRSCPTLPTVLLPPPRHSGWDLPRTYRRRPTGRQR